MTYAIFTPSYAGDYERCALLAESVTRFLPDCSHYILVDKIDYPRLSQLRSFGAIVIDSRELPSGRLHNLAGTRLWFTLSGKLLRG